MHALQLAWRHLQNMDRGTGDDPTGPYWLLQCCSTFSHLLSLAVGDVQVAGAFWSTNRRLDLSGGSQNRYQRTENLQRTTQISRIQHQGATNSTRHGTDRVFAAVCVGLDTYCQNQGACVGSPLAPVLCALVAAEQEFLTIRSLRTHLADAGLLRSFRYADNRCFFLRRSELQTEWTNLLFRLDFYGLPIELEQVPGEELLGSITSTQQGTITMQQPANETALRSLRSAGSKSAALSGFSARALSIKRHTRPIRLVRHQVEDLIEIYRRRGFSRTELWQLASRFRA